MGAAIINLSRRAQWLAGVLAALALLLFQSTVRVEAPEFEGFERIEWDLNNPCEEGLVCQSRPLTLRSGVFEFALPDEALRRVKGHIASLKTVSQDIGISRADCREEFRGWTTCRVQLDKGSIGKEAVLQLSPQKRLYKDSLPLVRSRVEFQSPASVGLWKLGEMLPQSAKRATPLLAALFVSLLLLSGARAFDRDLVVFALFLIAACGVHFRPDVYFYYDEWHVLERFMQNGPSSVVYRHNEHFLPVFFAFYYLESLVFGDRYLLYILLSLAVHALNAFLLFKLLGRLMSFHPASRRGALLLSAFYLLSSLHSEALHWAFEQSLLLSQTATLAALILGWEFVSCGGFRRICCCLFCLFLSPLLFGNGFAAFLYLTLVALGALFLLEPAEGIAGRFSRSSVPFRRVLTLLSASLLPAAMAAALYLVFREGAGHSFESAEPFENLSALWDYVLTGTQMGTMTRGLSLCASLDIDGARRCFFGLFEQASSPEIGLSRLGLFCGALLFIPTLFGSERRRPIVLWMLGELLLLSSFILPAFGRWSFGIQQSLSLRYQTASLLGWCLLLCPLCLFLYERLAERRSQGRFSLVPLVLLVITSALLSVQFRMARDFDYFTSRGAVHRNYAARLLDWENSLKRTAHGEKAAYEGTGTTLAGLIPLHPEGITPGRHPEQIYAVLNWLNPEKYRRR